MIKRSILLAVTLSTCLTTFGVAAAAPQSSLTATQQAKTVPAKPSAEKGDQVWNLKDVDIRTLAYEISKATGKNFVVGPKVDDKVTFITSHRLPKEELYEAFVALLQAYGYAAIPDGNVIKIINDSGKNQLRVQLEEDGIKTPQEGIVLKTVRVKNFPVTEMVKLIKPLIPKYSYVQAYKPSNDLIIADHVYHIDQMIELVHRLDHRTSKDFEIIRLRYSTAEDLAKTINELFKSRSKSQSEQSDISIVAEPRSNALVITGARPEQISNLKALIARLDIPDDVANERTEVLYLRYLPAETFAPIISGLIDSYLTEEQKDDPKRGQSTTNSSTSSDSTRQTPSLSGQFNLQDPLSNYGSRGSSSSSSGASSGYSSNAPRSGSIGSHVQWEASTNSVIITAPAAIIRRVRKVVNQLDIRRPQVLIEAVVAEVKVDRLHEIGVEWANFGGTQFHTRFPSSLGLSGIGQDRQFSAGGTADSIGSGLSLGVFKMGDLRYLLRALATDQDSNVLATPNLVTLDNEPALIKVGRKVSFTIGTIDNNPTGGNPFSSFDRQDVGLMLSVKPTITPEGSIRLNITQELSNVLEGTQRNSGGNPDTSERFIQTTVIADNDQILVLGGLLQKDWEKTVNKLPILGSIPVVGHLFSNHYKKLRKTNLMIFLHPVIMYGPDDNKLITAGKYEFLRQSQLHLRHDGVQRKATPVLPMRKTPVELPPAFRG